MIYLKSRQVQYENNPYPTTEGMQGPSVSARTAVKVTADKLLRIPGLKLVQHWESECSDQAEFWGT